MICAIVLAAGLSRRMGVQKLLLPCVGKTVIAHIIDQLLESMVDKVYVVTGHQAEQIGRELSQHLLARPRRGPNVAGRPVGLGRGMPSGSQPISAGSVSIVNNPDYESGMLSSVRCGLRALPEQCRAVLVALGDQPSISSKLIDQMIQSFAAAGKGILVPCYDGKRGHPILFSEVYRQEILTHYDDVGLRGLLHAHPDDVFELTVSNSSVLSDMDVPQDYRRELAAMEDNAEQLDPQTE